MEVSGVNKMYVRNLQDAYKLGKHIEYRNYDYVLGVGDGLKRASKIKIEQKFINQYRHSPIIKSGKDFYLPTWQLSVLDNCVLSQKPTNGRCNRVAYIVAKYIESAGLQTRYAYIHLPGKMSREIVSGRILSWATSIYTYKHIVD